MLSLPQYEDLEDALTCIRQASDRLAQRQDADDEAETLASIRRECLAIVAMIDKARGNNGQA